MIHLRWIIHSAFWMKKERVVSSVDCPGEGLALQRINGRPIMSWAREIIGNGCHGRRIHFVRVTMPGGNQEIHWPERAP
jgi:hypothetical protein